jgi:farnesyl-diphosphate farnesyltransferase
MEQRDAATHDYGRALSFCRAILPKVSRTFALQIGFLPGDLGKAVLVGYLICRIADTVEDDPLMSVSRKQQLLGRFLDCFDAAAVAESYALEAADVTGNPDHVTLLRGTADVFVVYAALPDESREIVRRWVGELVGGMSEFVERYPHGIRIQTMPEFRRYCYYVAGTVGHLLTELWRAHAAVGDRQYNRMLRTCEQFGEALQTVNILKDIAWDIERENAAYVPEELLRERGSSHQALLERERLRDNRKAIDALIQLAKSDLEAAFEYYSAIPKRAIPIRIFCLLPILFAVATLREIERSTAMLEPGGGVKITRREVRSLILAGSVSTVSNHATRWLFSKASRDRFVPFATG